MIETDVLKNVKVFEYSKSDGHLYKQSITDVYKMTETEKVRGIVSLQFAIINGVNFTIYNDKIPTSELERFMKEYVEGKPVIEIDGDYVNMATVAVINPTYANVDKKRVTYYSMDSTPNVTPRELHYDKNREEYHCYY